MRRLLQRGDLADASHFKGHQVELYWPVDDTWWLARIIKVYGLLAYSCDCTNDCYRAGVTDIAVATWWPVCIIKVLSMLPFFSNAS